MFRAYAACWVFALGVLAVTAHSGHYDDDEDHSHPPTYPPRTTAAPPKPTYAHPTMFPPVDPCEGRPTLVCTLAATVNLDVENRTSKVSGVVTIEPDHVYEADDKEDCPGKEQFCVVRITGKISGLGDDTPHGYHIHTYGNISTPDGLSTGGHYDPEGVPHALPIGIGLNTRHVGDLGNLSPSKDGVVVLDQKIILDTLDVLGRGLIVHAKPDDGGQPTGNAGARLAQCVLGRAD